MILCSIVYQSVKIKCSGQSLLPAIAEPTNTRVLHLRSYTISICDICICVKKLSSFNRILMHAEEADTNHSTKKFSCFRGPKSDHFLASSVRQSVIVLDFVQIGFVKLLHGFLQVVTRICQIWYIDFYKLIHGLLYCWYMALSELIPVFL